MILTRILLALFYTFFFRVTLFLVKVYDFLTGHFAKCYRKNNINVWK